MQYLAEDSIIGDYNNRHVLLATEANKDAIQLSNRHGTHLLRTQSLFFLTHALPILLYCIHHTGASAQT